MVSLICSVYLARQGSCVFVLRQLTHLMKMITKNSIKIFENYLRLMVFENMWSMNSSKFFSPLFFVDVKHEGLFSVFSLGNTF